MKNKKVGTSNPKKRQNLKAEFSDIEDNKLTVHYSTAHGRVTNSIDMGYEDLRSIFKEAENIMLQNTKD